MVRNDNAYNLRVLLLKATLSVEIFIMRTALYLALSNHYETECNSCLFSSVGRIVERSPAF